MGDAQRSAQTENPVRLFAVEFVASSAGVDVEVVWPLMGDFGAASRLDGFDPRVRERLQRVEVRAFGCLLDDLIGLVQAGRWMTDSVMSLRALRDDCLVEEIDRRPLFGEIVRRL